MSKLPEDFSYVLELAKPPTVEEELEMEKMVRHALQINDIDELKRHIEAGLRQNYQQSVFISHCLDKIHYMYAKIACMENRVVQPKPSWFAKLFNRRS